MSEILDRGARVLNEWQALDTHDDCRRAFAAAMRAALDPEDEALVEEASQRAHLQYKAVLALPRLLTLAESALTARADALREAAEIATQYASDIHSAANIAAALSRAEADIAELRKDMESLMDSISRAEAQRDALAKAAEPFRASFARSLEAFEEMGAWPDSEPWEMQVTLGDLRALAAAADIQDN